MKPSDWSEKFRVQNSFLAVILTADEMKDQYERAMKLHMSNKINEKNVYQLNLNLIDCIHQGNFSNDRFLFSRFSHISSVRTRLLDFQ